MKETGLHRNGISYLGLLVMLTSAGLILLSALIDLGFGRPNPYLGIITYMALPGVATLGLVAFLFGMRRESLRRRKSGHPEARAYPAVDLNDPRERKRFVAVVVGGAVMITVLTFAAYNAFLFTESVTFCGKICHSVMAPEYTAYTYSPHARVSCVECHVGAGASWYVRSKLSGARQVLAVTFNTYERPIPVPIENLRPARETCEHCHWPEKFFGAQLVQNPHFRYDEKNTAEQVSFLVKTGGGARTTGTSTGIHWHMVIGNHIRFVSLDKQKQNVPLIMVERADGTKATYKSLDLPAPDEKTISERTSLMDCMDCHNRPTHIYLAPDVAIDRELAGHRMPADLPWIKREAVYALLQKYPDREAAHQGINKSLMGFYTTNYPDLLKTRGADVQTAVDATLGVYDRTNFPEMNVNPSTYPMHLGHRNWPGCMRCHDGRHVSDDGRTLTRNCNGSCHTMPTRGPLSPLGGETTGSDQGWHPWELKGKHAEVLCSKCHGVDLPLRSTCQGCHAFDQKAPMMTDMQCGDCHQKEQFKQPVADCKSCHADRKGLHTSATHADTSCTDCHKPHGWKVTGRDVCLTCHDDLKEHKAKEGDCAKCHAFK